MIVDVTGSVEFGARIAIDAFENAKDVVLMNAELDGTIGPDPTKVLGSSRASPIRLQR